MESLTNELPRARTEMTEAFRTSLELHLRLLHSTESDPAAIRRSHDSFCDLLERIAAHPRLPHIQQFSDLNRDEFLRAESDYIRQFALQIAGASANAARILQIPLSEFVPRYTVAELADRMLEARRAGAPNQFTEAHRVAFLTLFDPPHYYGQIIAKEFFPQADDAPAQDAPASHPPVNDDMGESFLKVKAKVITESVRHYQRRNEDVLAVALLRLKGWLVPEPDSSIERHLKGLDDLIAAPRGGAALRIGNANPRRLTIVFDSPSGVRAVFDWGIGNGQIRRIFPGLALPAIETACVSLVLSTGSGDRSGFAYVAEESASAAPLDQLAALIKKLDFTSEYLRLLSQPEPPPKTSVAEEHSELMRLAEAL